ncbi:MAG: hypothetical protein KJ899_15190 [Gammaproteobacteria bacterium]|nr:hypothetical protein [Gammaproteobacteria bacterium]
MADSINVTFSSDTIDVTMTGGVAWDAVTGKPTATAENDFIVADDSLDWVKKTSAQVKAIVLPDDSFQQEIIDILGSTTVDISVTTYKNWEVAFIDMSSGDYTVNLNNTSNGDAGMLVLTTTGTPDSITLGSMFTTQLGTDTIDTNSGSVNVISWVKGLNNIYYTINVKTA